MIQQIYEFSLLGQIVVTCRMSNQYVNEELSDLDVSVSSEDEDGARSASPEKVILHHLSLIAADTRQAILCYCCTERLMLIMQYNIKLDREM